MGMKLTDHITHGAGRFLEFRIGPKAELTHGVNDAPLYRLQAIADVWQGPVENHVHRIIEVRLLCILF